MSDFEIIIAITTVIALIPATWIPLHIFRAGRFNKVATSFTDTFRHELRDIYPLPVQWPKDIDQFLRSKFPVLQQAIDEFGEHLSRSEQRSMRAAWVAYYNDHGDERCQSYLHYRSFENNPNYKENFKHNVDKLLSFAKQK